MKRWSRKRTCEHLEEKELHFLQDGFSCELHTYMDDEFSIHIIHNAFGKCSEPEIGAHPTVFDCEIVVHTSEIIETQLDK